MRIAHTLRVFSSILLSLSAAIAQSPTSKIVKAANTFLSTLDQKQHRSILFAFDDEKQRARWSNLPTSMVRREGLSMGELTAPQRTAALALVSSALSPRGFEKVQQIMEADEVLKTNEGSKPIFGKDLYYVSILGTPSEKEAWMLQFGGHHLALNITIAGDRGVLTPSLIGAQPALYVVNGKTVRPLGEESDKAITRSMITSASRRFWATDWSILCSDRGKMARPSNPKAIPPCIFIPCTAIRPTTMAGSSLLNEHQASCCDSCPGRDACICAQAG